MPLHEQGVVTRALIRVPERQNTVSEMQILATVCITAVRKKENCLAAPASSFVLGELTGPDLSGRDLLL